MASASVPANTQPKLARYSGAAQWEPYLAQLQLAARHCGWSKGVMATHLALAVEGPALQILLDLDAADQGNLKALTAVIDPGEPGGDGGPWPLTCGYTHGRATRHSAQQSRKSSHCMPSSRPLPRSDCASLHHEALKEAERAEDVLCQVPGQTARPRVRKVDCYKEESAGHAHSRSSNDSVLRCPLHHLTDKYQPFVWMEKCTTRSSWTPTPVTWEWELSSLSVMGMSPEQLQEGQEADGTLRKVRGWLEAGQPLQWAEVLAEGPKLKGYYRQWRSLELWDGLAYWQWQAPGLGSDLLQLLVPRVLTSNCHTGIQPLHARLSPELQSHWRGPGEVVGRLSEVTYRVRMPNRGRLVMLHQDRLAPYHPLAAEDAAGGQECSSPVPSTPPAAEEVTQHTTVRPTRQ
ncbi:hypothetical protein AAFF_G00147490 [Aldrovandia affinis]|uniref:Integrase p58-like C-terminal domain-containing protein n=1 Tax=Aldrovandia affinis TaxID=143900 RepID=A0AAD7W913_9TELE|nr:hypothetical protein AAFF_G00147490 [Aldrovandia affinis]